MNYGIGLIKSQGEKGVDIKATSRQARRFYYDYSVHESVGKKAGDKKKGRLTSLLSSLCLGLNIGKDLGLIGRITSSKS